MKEEKRGKLALGDCSEGAKEFTRFPRADAEAQDPRVRDPRTRAASGQQARYTRALLSRPFFGCSGASRKSQRLCIRNVPGERNGPVRAATAPGDSRAHCVLGQGKG